MIETRELCKRYGRITAVDGISFRVEPGQVLGFLGPNGAGKSTTMKMIAGFVAPTAGTAKVCGFDVESQPLEAKRELGYLPEGAPSYGEMTVAAFLGFIADVRGLDGERRRQRIDDAVGRLNLGGVLGQPIETLSKGFRRRVGLAQAILHDPRVLILDEPTDGLDPNQKHEVRALINAMAKDKTIVVSTHILEEVHAVCTRAIIIARGKHPRRRHAGRAGGALALPQRGVADGGQRGRRARRAGRACPTSTASRSIRWTSGSPRSRATGALDLRRGRRPAQGAGHRRSPNCSSNAAASTRCSAPSPRARRRKECAHEPDRHPVPARAGELLRDAAWPTSSS